VNPRLFLPIVLAASACASAPAEPDRAAYLAHMPRSILVLPMSVGGLDGGLDGGVDPEAARAWLPTITRPLAERGYYVFPVAVADAILEEHGSSSRRELRELFGADAVLYVDVVDWGPSLHDLQLETKVTLAARLVDLSSGAELWRGTSSVVQSAGERSLFDAIVSGPEPVTTEPSIGLARQANWVLVHSPEGLLLGPRHPGFAEDQREHREKLSSTAR
jgi:hypothetical protein